MRNLFLPLASVAALTASVPVVLSPALAQPAPAAAPAPETEALSVQVGRWTVVDTFRSSPNAKPEVSTGLVADRRMVGTLLEETLHAESAPKPLRIDYLGFDATAGQWRYISIEARIPVAPMSAASFDRDPADRIALRFDPFAAPPIAPEWAGRLLRMEEIITRDGPNHEIKDQYFVLAGGDATRWLAHRYDYRRQR